jgi:hypothetical protein
MQEKQKQSEYKKCWKCGASMYIISHMARKDDPRIQKIKIECCLCKHTEFRILSTLATKPNRNSPTGRDSGGPTGTRAGGGIQLGSRAGG